jgi:hypothetical protein
VRWRRGVWKWRERGERGGVGGGGGEGMWRDGNWRDEGRKEGRKEEVKSLMVMCRISYQQLSGHDISMICFSGSKCE